MDRCPLPRGSELNSKSKARYYISRPTSRFDRVGRVGLGLVASTSMSMSRLRPKGGLEEGIAKEGPLEAPESVVRPRELAIVLGKVHYFSSKNIGPN